MENDLIKNLIKRLDLQISFMLSPLDVNASDQDKISRLDSFGLTPTEIATILGSTSDKISKQLYVIRNKNNRKK